MGKKKLINSNLVDKKVKKLINSDLFNEKLTNSERIAPINLSMHVKNTCWEMPS